MVEVRSARPGDEIFHEGDPSHDLYMIRTGRVVIISRRADGTEHSLAEFGEGTEFGELGFLDGSTRSATACATAPTELLVLRRERVSQLPAGTSILDHLAKQIAVTSAERLKATSRDYVASLQAKVEMLRLQHDFGEFFIYIMACYAIGTIINILLKDHLPGLNLYSRAFSWSYLLVLLVPSLVIVWRLHVPVSGLGITLRGWRRSVGEGLVASAACVLLYFLAVVVLRSTKWATPPSIAWASAAWVPSYFVHAAIQEFLARGIVQGSFVRFFGDAGGWKSVWLASVLFSLFHVHFGLTAVAVTFFSSLVFGWLYLRHENILGVAVLHGVAGSLAFLLGIL